MASLARAIRDFWFAVTGQHAREPIAPEVIVHDPGSQRPHDLDDPFFDPEVQSRMAGVIADNAAKKN
jgi:nitrogen-specific signal transduction histidine kinase